VKWVWRAVLAFFLVAGGYPLFWTASSSLRPAEAIRRAPWALPESLDGRNYARVLEARFPEAGGGGPRQFTRYYANSVCVTALAVAAVLVLGAPAAYALARMRGGAWLYVLFVGGMMIPVHIVLVPLIKLHAFLGTYDTPAALVLTYTAFGLPLAVFILHGFFREVPGELMDAARMDGCSSWGMFRHVALPLAKPALATVAILNVVTIWNEFIFARTLINSPRARTLPYGLTEFARASEHATDVGAVAAALVLASVPAILAYAILQRRIISGLSAGALKG